MLCPHWLDSGPGLDWRGWRGVWPVADDGRHSHGLLAHVPGTRPPRLCEGQSQLLLSDALKLYLPFCFLEKSHSGVL